MKFNTIRPTLYEMLKRVLQVEIEGWWTVTQNCRKTKTSLVKVNIWANIKASGNVILVFNFTYFLQGLKDKYIKIIRNICFISTTYKDIIGDTDNHKGGKRCVGVVFLKNEVKFVSI